MTNPNYILRKNRAENCVLIADDDLLIRTMIKKGLSSMSRVEEAEKGNDVLSAYQQHLPDIVLLDIHMPEKKGFETLQEILKFDPTAFVIMLSSDAIKDNIVRCSQNGAKGFIGKPFHRDVLMRYIHMCDTIHYSDASEVIDLNVLSNENSQAL